MSANPQKHRTGLDRVWHAFGYSLSGLKAGWHEKAFRQEAIGAFVLVGAILFAAIWVAWGFGPMLAALVMFLVGIWLGRRLEA